MDDLRINDEGFWVASSKIERAIDAFMHALGVFFRPMTWTEEWRHAFVLSLPLSGAVWLTVLGAWVILLAACVVLLAACVVTYILVWDICAGIGSLWTGRDLYKNRPWVG